MSGLLLNITGDGKGKTTSALGMALRSLGYGRKVTVFQFVKGDFPTGERAFFAALNSPNFVMEQAGAGFTWKQGPDHGAFARQGWAKVLPWLTGEKRCDLLILDELNIALHEGFLNTDEVISAFRNRPPELDVVVTGRYAPQALLDASALVSRIECVKHPFDSGKSARKGIDY